MRSDVVVVGNGPSGCEAARHASKGHDTVLVGCGKRRVQCAGLISKSGMERIGVKEDDFILNTVRGARIFSPGGVKIEVDGRRPVAYAVDRLAFDRHLLEKAQDSGARYVEDWATKVGQEGVCLRGAGEVKSDRTILATGTDYTLQMECKIERPTEFLVGGQYEMDAECDRDFVELHFVVPDFFAWVIPLKDRARIGLCVKGNPRPHLDRFVKRLKAAGRLKSDRVYAESFGIIPVHKPSMKTQFGNVVTLGDAAGQVKASTGGGIIFGIQAAEHACSPDYERLWRGHLGFDLRLHLMIHRTLNRLSDKGKDRFFRIVGESRAALENCGDMDYAEKTLGGVLKDPKFVLKTAANMPWLLADLLC
jgi:digeranylgeranylglycerophospholipid reductase